MTQDFLESLLPIAISTVGFYLSINVFASKLCRILLRERYTRLSMEHQIEVANGVVCGVNGALAFAAACLILMTYDFSVDLIGTSNTKVKLLACTQAGYFIADSIMLLRNPNSPGRFTYLLHHAVCLLAYYVVVVHEIFSYHMTLRTINEFSTLFFNGRRILELMNMKQETIYVVNGLAFMVSFFVGRILLLPVNYYTLLSATSSETYMNLNAIQLLSFFVPSVSVDVLNVYWFTLVVKGFVKYWSKPRKHGSVKNK